MRKSQKHLFSLSARDLDEILRAAAADLEALRGRKLFLTGGTGFFGKWLVAGLLHANAEMDLGLELTVLSRHPAAFAQKYPEVGDMDALSFLQGDVAHFSADNRRFDYILHAATDTAVYTNEADERERSQAIVAGTRHMLVRAKESGARMLHVSTGAVYGTASAKRTGAIEEDDVGAQPLTPYAEAKCEAEQLCAESGADFVIARAFAFLGPHLALDAHFAAGNFLRDAMRGGPILVRGDGTALRSYLYPVDLVVWLLRILVRGGRGRAYNVGSDEVVSTAELARLIADTVAPKPEVVVQSVQPQGPQNIYLPNIARARSELHLDVTVPLHDAIRRTLDFLASRTD